MLTAAQVETVGYVTDGGIVCSSCALKTFENEGGAGVAEYRPLSRYEADEYAGELAQDDYGNGEHEARGCTEDCEPFGLPCDDCGEYIVEPYHYGHEDEALRREDREAGGDATTGVIR